MKTRTGILMLAVLLTCLWGCGGSQVETKGDDTAAVLENSEETGGESGEIETASEEEEDVSSTSKEELQESIDLKQLLLGEWILELNPGRNDNAVYGSKLTLYEDMTYEYGYDTRIKGRRRGSWDISEDESSTITMMDEEKLYSYVFTTLEEDGLLKLVNADNGAIYIRPEDEDAVYETKYMSVLITEKNRDQYIGEFRYVGPSIKEIESKGIVDFYIVESLVYKDGWIYVGASDNFSVLFDEEHEVRKYPYGLTWVEKGNPDPENHVPYEVFSIMGRIYYIREEYVDHVYIDENGTRVVVQKSGMEICSDYYWDYLPEGTYEQYPY